MTAYSYSSSTSLPILPIFLMGIIAALLALSTLGTGATVQIASPKQTPDPNRIGGVDIGKAVSEAKDLIPNLTPGDSLAGYLKSTNGLLRVMIDLNGDLLVVGQGTSANLTLAAEAIAAAIGATVGW